MSSLGVAPQLLDDGMSCLWLGCSAREAAAVDEIAWMSELMLQGGTHMDAGFQDFFRRVAQLFVSD